MSETHSTQVGRESLPQAWGLQWRPEAPLSLGTVWNHERRSLLSRTELLSYGTVNSWGQTLLCWKVVVGGVLLSSSLVLYPLDVSR